MQLDIPSQKSTMVLQITQACKLAKSKKYKVFKPASINWMISISLFTRDLIFIIWILRQIFFHVDILCKCN